MQRLLVLGCCLVFSAALVCSPSDEDDDDKQQDGPLTLEKFDTEMNRLACDQAVCGGWQSPSTCALGDDASGLDEMKRAMAAGRITFDATAAAKCLEVFKKLDPATCWGAGATLVDESEFERICQPAFKGLVANGADCYDTDECAAGTCSFEGEACPGKCAAFRTVGQSCGVDGFECAEGLDCSGEDVCVAQAAVGESCEDVRCADGLVCDADSKCATSAAPAGVGGACDDARPCASGSYCNRPDWPEAGQCAALVAPGGDCSFAFECQGRQLCVGAGEGFDGEVKGKCGLPRDVGGACVASTADFWVMDSGCYGGLACDAATSKCASWPKAGQPCVNDECADGAYCNDKNQCVAQVADGESCRQPQECLSWDCNLSEGVCVTELVDGGECVAP